MAVTKIRRMSSWTLLICAAISIVVFAMFYLGGVEADSTPEMKKPIYTGLLLNWMYILFALTAISTLVFAIWQFMGTMKVNPKGALLGLGVIVAFFVLMFVCYSIGDGTPLQGLNADIQQYNTSFWLKMTDMWLYSTYILLIMAVLAILWGSLKKVMGK